MNRREQILEIADELIRTRGYNAFSFSDISHRLNVKNPSIHYHFPQKTDLGLAVIALHREELLQLMTDTKPTSKEKLERLFLKYEAMGEERKICLTGSLSTDLNTLDESICRSLKNYINLKIEWLSGILREGKKEKVFKFSGEPKIKALLLIGNLVGLLQLARVADETDFKKGMEEIRMGIYK